MKCIGIMTGNSLDAVDTVLTEFSDSRMTDICSHSREIPADIAEGFRTLKQKLSQCDGDIQAIFAAAPEAFLQLHSSYIRLVAQTVTELVEKSSVPAAEIKAVGFHGQTCHHLPPSIAGASHEPSSLQIGSGQMLADLIGIPVIFDFRSADIMNGGEGAPLAPVHNRHLAENLRQQNIFPVAFCNGGNTGNIAIISSDINTQEIGVIGWDTGPFNHFVDYLARTEKNRPCDLNGEFGRQGTVNMDLLENLFDNAVCSADGKNFLTMTPPKSSDPAWYKILPAMTDQAVPFVDRIRTAEFFSAYSFVYNLRHIPFNLHRPKHFLLFGGGWNNPVILEDFQNLLRGKKMPLPKHINTFQALAEPEAIVEPADKYGHSAKYMEARIFADMAKCFLTGEAFSFPSTTGCLQPTVGGTIARPGGDNRQLWSQAAKGWRQKKPLS